MTRPRDVITLPAQIGSLPEGEMSRCVVVLGELLDGTAVTTQVIVIRGSRPGPSLYVGSTIHGDEVTGIEVLRQVVRAIDPRELAGNLICVPVQNPLAYRDRGRFIPVRASEAFWPDVHTAFPGSADGELPAVMAHRLLTRVMRQADYAIDLHAALAGGEYVDHARSPSPMSDPTGRAQELAMVFGTRIVIVHAEGAPERPNMLHEAASRSGIPSFLVEFSTNGQVSPSSTAAGVAGVTNVLHHLKMMGGVVRARSDQLVVRDVRYARAGRGGMPVIHCQLGQHVRRGDLLATMYDLWFDEVESIDSPCDGIVYRLTVPRPLNATERLAGIVVVDQDRQDGA